MTVVFPACSIDFILKPLGSHLHKSYHNFSFQTHPSVDVSKVKDLLAKHFPDASALSLNDDDATKWLESVLENLKIQLVSKSSRSGTSTNSPIANNNVTNNNHLNNCRDVEKSNLNNSTVNGDSNSFASSNAENELVLLQNAQLKTTVEEYKNIIAETVSVIYTSFLNFPSLPLWFI